MILRLYNTLNRAKEDFVPFDAAHVRMYVCGPTVYDRAHIGNARPLIVFDVLYRLLREIYGYEQVTYVRNITDVDDKINARAAERGVPIRVLTDETARAFEEDVAALGCLPPTVQPRATEHISEMKTMIEALVERGIAYVAQDHALFSVSAMNARGKAPKYGSLSRRSLDEMIAGARVEVAPYKREPTDFVLWKPSKLGEPAWESPCEIAAKGRPGWHIECSAMSFKHLVEEFAGRLKCEDAYRNAFDIHGGGIDLVFPHHENEIAQSCCALDSELMARVWMHNGFLQVEGEKMAKSAGNFVTIDELLRTNRFGGRAWSGEVLRLAMLRTHYRQPIDFTLRALEEAERQLDKWYEIVRDIEPADEIAEGVRSALEDDLNTPAAIGELHRLASPSEAGLMEAGVSRLAQRRAPEVLKRSANLLGLLLSTKSERDQDVANQVDLSRVEELIARRSAARSTKNWLESDRIRDDLDDMGITLNDNKDGTTSWELKR